MNDEHFDRGYQSARSGLNDGLDRLFAGTGRSVAGAFGALHRIRFEAPWNRRRRDVGCA